MTPRHPLRVGLAVVATLSALVAAASPAAASVTVTGASPDAEAMILELDALGVEFWTGRNVGPWQSGTCPSPAIAVVPRPAGIAGAAGATIGVVYGFGGCRMELSRSLVRDAAREHYRPGFGGDSDRESLGTTILHELGHTGGLGHTGEGLMAADGQAPTPYPVHAWFCDLERGERHAIAAKSARRAAKRAARRALRRARHHRRARHT